MTATATLDMPPNKRKRSNDAQDDNHAGADVDNDAAATEPAEPETDADANVFSSTPNDKADRPGSDDNDDGSGERENGDKASGDDGDNAQDGNKNGFTQKSLDWVQDTDADSPEQQPPEVQFVPFTPKEMLQPEQLQAIAEARAYADRMTAQILGIPQTIRIQPVQPAHGLDGRMLSGLSRIYIGAIHADVNEEHIRMAFTQCGFIKSVSLNYDPATGRHRGFCFLEFDELESATLAIKLLHGVELAGRPLRVSRPSSFSNFDFSILPPAPKNRIYISNVSEFVTEDDVKALFETFGPVEQCSMIPNPLTRQHKTYGYLQFANEDAVPVALGTMNNFELGGRNLHVEATILSREMPLGMQSLGPATTTPAVPIPESVMNVASSINSSVAQRATAGPSPSIIDPAMLARVSQAAAAHAASGTDIVSVVSGGIIGAIPGQPGPATGLQPISDESATLEENVSISASQRYSIMQKLMRSAEGNDSIPTSILELKNMVAIEDIDEFINQEIAQECSKYGTVSQVVLWKDPTKAYGPADLVLVYVEFGSLDAAIHAKSALDGRFFGGRQIQAKYGHLPPRAPKK